MEQIRPVAAIPMTRTAALRGVAITVVAALLAGCPSPVRQPVPEAPPPAVPSAPEVRGAVVYEVDPDASSVKVLVYRGGTLARFGHNHVMTIRGLQGRVWSHASVQRTGFDVSFPVAQMVVDDPQARREAGSDFPPGISEADREGTRKNMLRAEVLDGDRYPVIRLRTVNSAGSVENPQVTAQVTIRDATRELQIRPVVKLEGNRLTATGEFDLLQSDFGIKPFSAALGALAVQDRLHVTFAVVARKK